MDLRFNGFACPKCGEEELSTGNTEIGRDVTIVKYCAEPDCDFKMIVIVPNKEYEYSIHRKLIKEEV